MAAIHQSLAETGRRSSSSSRKGPLSHGRGGAGNMGSSPADLEPVALETPTLKGERYTTGRGGSGNMAKNDDPEAARRAQDVVANPRRESINSAHVGRGGAANVFRPSQAEIEATKQDNAKWESAISDDKSDTSRTPAPKGLAEKGKEWLGGLVAKKQATKETKS